MKRQILETVVAVNMDISETDQDSPLLVFDSKTQSLTPSSYLKRKQDDCVTQSIDFSLCKDRKRVVWTYISGEKLFVCTNFFTEHSKPKSKNSYNKTCSFAALGLDSKGKEISLQRIQEENYLDADNLLQECIADMSVSKTIQEPVESVKPKAEEKVAEIRSGKRQRIHTIKTEKVEYAPHKPRVVNKSTPATEVPDVVPILIEPKEEEQMPKTSKQEKPTPIAIPLEEVKSTEQQIEKDLAAATQADKKIENMVDVFAAAKYLESFIQMIDEVVKKGLESVGTETDIEKQLNQTSTIHEVLLQKKKIQKMMPEFNKTILLLDVIQKNIIKTK